MKITVAVCTYNRCSTLYRCLRHISEMNIPSGVCWEVIVIDNNSSDKTSEVAQEFMSAIPLVYYLEKKQGIAHARNRAITEASGQYLIYIDDDAFVDTELLAVYHKAFNTWKNLPFFGGRILPYFEASPPKWLVGNLDKVDIVYALLDFGAENILFPEHRLPFGANVAINLTLLKELRFNTSLGRIGAGLLVGEESDFLRRARQKYGNGMYLGKACVSHYVPPERATRQHIWRYYVGQGKTAIFADGIPEGRRIWSVPRWIIVKCAFLICKCSIRFLLGKSGEWLQEYKMIALLWGMITASREQKD